MFSPVFLFHQLHSFKTNKWEAQSLKESLRQGRILSSGNFPKIPLLLLHLLLLLVRLLLLVLCPPLPSFIDLLFPLPLPLLQSISLLVDFLKYFPPPLLSLPCCQRFSKEKESQVLEGKMTHFTAELVL